MLAFFKLHKTLAVTLVVMSLPLVLYPRFNRQDVQLIQPLIGTRAGEVQIDMKCYLNFVNYFRGQLPLESVTPPFSYRPLVPYLASRLPFDPFLSFNLVNVLALCLTPPVIFFMFRKMGFAFEYGIAACLLYTLSFPVFYYGPSGYIDATAMLIMFLMISSRVYEQDYWLPLWCGIGGLTKETVIVVFPYLLVDMLVRQRPIRSNLAFWGLGLAAYLGAVCWARTAFGAGVPFVWKPAGVFLGQNLYRLKTYISFMLAFGLPGIFATWYIIRHFRTRFDRNAIPLIVGMFSGLSLFGYSFLSAYADGRFVWTAYPFMIGLSLYYFKGKAATIAPVGVYLASASLCFGGGNRIPNGDWATREPLDAWIILHGDKKVLSFDKGKEGDQCLKINMQANQSINMETPYIILDPKRKYRLLYHYKTNAKQIAWSGVTIEYFMLGRSLGSQSLAFQDHQADWIQKEYLLIIPEATTACKVRLNAMDAGEYWIDEIAINEIGRRAARRLSLIGKMEDIPVRKAEARPQIPPEGKYSVRQMAGVWWLFDPMGKAYWNVSLWGGGPIGDWGELPLRRHIRDAYLIKGKTNEYDNLVFDRLIAWGFNSIGSGIEIDPMNQALQMRRQTQAKTLPYVDTIVMSLNLPHEGGFRLWEIAESLYGAGNVKVEDLSMVDRDSVPVLGTEAPFPDVFNEKFRKAYDQYVKEWFEKRKSGDLFAVCLDNELPWAELPKLIYSPACRREFENFAKQKFKGSIDDNNDLVYEFLRHYVKEYFAFQISTVRKYRPDILIIGQRLPCANAMDSFGRMKYIYDWCLDLFSVYDMIGLNMYPQGQDHFTHDQMKTLEYFHQKTGRPIIITEWCICCEESGVPTTVGWPLWSTVPTWEDRGNGYKNCLTQLASLPFVVGAHWFSSYNGYVWHNGVRFPGYNHGFYQDDFVPNPVFLKKAVEANRIVTQMERKADFTVDDIHYLKE
ncbi:MAG: hypothetical protein WCS52_10330 [bacterium]